jgi:hypothetical protein
MRWRWIYKDEWGECNPRLVDGNRTVMEVYESSGGGGEMPVTLDRRKIEAAEDMYRLLDKETGFREAQALIKRIDRGEK